MTIRRSRTYRIGLSQEGTDLFLTCHCRLAHLTGLFIPYGATLFVAVLLAEVADLSELAAQLGDRTLSRLSGRGEYFVGASAALPDIVTTVSERVESIDTFAKRPAAGHVHLASLALMATCDDDALADAYKRMTVLLSTV